MAGEPLPRTLYEKLCEQKTYQAGMGMIRQLFFGTLDMALHHTYACLPFASHRPTFPRR